MSFLNKYKQDRLNDAAQAEKLSSYFGVFQFLLAIFIIISCFYFKHWLSGLMIIGMVAALIQPAIFFYFVSLENKLNFNDEATDKQHQRTVQEANELFYKMDNEINLLKERCNDLTCKDKEIFAHLHQRLLDIEDRLKMGPLYIDDKNE